MQCTKIVGPTVLAVRGTGGQGAVLAATASASQRLTLVRGWGRNCWKGIYHSLHNARDVVRSEGMGRGSSSFGLCRLRDATSSGRSLRKLQKATNAMDTHPYTIAHSIQDSPYTKNN